MKYVDNSFSHCEVDMASSHGIGSNTVWREYMYRCRVSSARANFYN